MKIGMASGSCDICCL